MHSPFPRRDLLSCTAGHYVTINAVQTGRGCRNGCRIRCCGLFIGIETTNPENLSAIGKGFNQSE